ncbi:hypothetical protein JCM12214_16120 [Geobacillus vulcani]
MNYLYKPGDLEMHISTVYQQYNILYPYQLDEQYLADVFDISIVYASRSFGYWDDCRIIGLHKDLRFDSAKRRAVFFHELGHLLLHVGDQLNMSKSFRDYQEIQANRFMLFAAIPYHMLTYIDLSAKRDFILCEMQDLFKVPVDVCASRLDYIEKKILQICAENSLYYRL